MLKLHLPFIVLEKDIEEKALGTYSMSLLTQKSTGFFLYVL